MKTSECEFCGGFGFVQVVDITGAEVEECDCTPDPMPPDLAERLWANVQAEIRIVRDEPGAA